MQTIRIFLYNFLINGKNIYILKTVMEGLINK